MVPAVPAGGPPPRQQHLRLLVLEAHLPRVPSQGAHVKDQLEGRRWPPSSPVRKTSLQGLGDPGPRLHRRFPQLQPEANCQKPSVVSIPSAAGDSLPVLFAMRASAPPFQPHCGGASALGEEGWHWGAGPSPLRVRVFRVGSSAPCRPLWPSPTLPHQQSKSTT